MPKPTFPRDMLERWFPGDHRMIAAFEEQEEAVESATTAVAETQALKDASVLVLSANGEFTNERVLEAGPGILMSVTADRVRLSVSGSAVIPDGDKGDITVTGSGTIWTIRDNVVGNAELADMPQATFKMRAAGAGTGDPIDGTPAQAKAALAIAAADVSGLGTAAVKNTGTSGNTVPLLDGANTWSAVQTFNAGQAIGGTNPAVALYGDASSFFPGIKIWHQGQTLDTDAISIMPYNGGSSVAAFRMTAPSGSLFTFFTGATQQGQLDGSGFDATSGYRVGGTTVIDSNRLHRLRTYTVATLPAAGTAGRKAFVADANSTTFASVVAGGGANGVPVYDDGTNWRIG